MLILGSVLYRRVREIPPSGLPEPHLTERSQDPGISHTVEAGISVPARAPNLRSQDWIHGMGILPHVPALLPWKASARAEMLWGALAAFHRHTESVSSSPDSSERFLTAEMCTQAQQWRESWGCQETKQGLKSMYVPTGRLRKIVRWSGERGLGCGDGRRQECALIKSPLQLSQSCPAEVGAIPRSWVKLTAISGIQRPDVGVSHFYTYICVFIPLTRNVNAYHVPGPGNE